MGNYQTVAELPNKLLPTLAISVESNVVSNLELGKGFIGLF